MVEKRADLMVELLVGCSVLKKAERLVVQKVAPMVCRLAVKMDGHWVVNLDLPMAALMVGTKAAHSAES